MSLVLQTGGSVEGEWVLLLCRSFRPPPPVSGLLASSDFLSPPYRRKNSDLFLFPLSPDTHVVYGIGTLPHSFLPSIYPLGEWPYLREGGDRRKTIGRNRYGPSHRGSIEICSTGGIPLSIPPRTQNSSLLGGGHSLSRTDFVVINFR